VNCSSSEAGDWPAWVVTLTSTVPVFGVSGEVTVIDVADLTVNVVAALVPKLIPVTPRMAVPVRVTTVPPESGPKLGCTPVTVGAGDVVEGVVEGEVEVVVEVEVEVEVEVVDEPQICA
jgi:hypothetical protein